MKIAVIFLIPCVLLTQNLQAGAEFSEQDTIYAYRMQEQVVIDGLIDESIWQKIPAISAFKQRDPNEGENPTQKTLVRIAYDDHALYIAASMYDTSPDSIIARLARRDYGYDSDAFGVFIDPYLDRRSGFFFGLNAAGSYFDGVLLNDDWDDDSWDGVWEGKVNLNGQGWTAEFRIPYSQLRFHESDSYTWGINFRRDIRRKNEIVYLVYTPKDGSGFVSRFPQLVGIENIDAARSMEVLPYFRTKAEYLDVEQGNPFNDGSRYLPDMGADFKMGIGNNLTLDGTVNPDFGQVEVDPAVVNLSDVESFFSEKRPFFIENASLFWFGHGGSRSNWSFNWGNPDFFYSRRIGRAPQGSLPDNDFSDTPDGTRILGATKLSGKIGGDWNVGTIQAVTNREYADLDTSGRKFDSEVEPATYYGIFRAQKEYDKGFTSIGFISTVTNRFFKDQRLRDEINSQAYTFGLDGWTFLDKDRMWVITSWFGMSHVRGNETRMVDLQRSSRHYLQRPDAGHVNVDSSARHLTGYGGRIMVNKQKGNIVFNSAIGFIDPKFDINDAGFMWRGDVINAHTATGYRWTDPTTFYHRAGVNLAFFGSMDFDKNITWAGIFSNAWITFPNYYNLELMYAYNPETTSNRRTRGGPLTKTPSGWELNLWFNTDDRQDFVGRLSTFGYYRGKKEWNRAFEVGIEWKALSNLSLNISQEIQWNKEFAQWVDVFEDPLATNTFGNRYVFAEMDQVELSGTIRVNWTFTPRLSLQLYVQPLISSGDYKNFKELALPNTYDFNNYTEISSRTEDGEIYYTADPDGNGPAETLEFSDPDFNIKSIRANAVLRWEYLPGSTLFLVWTQSRFDAEQDGRFRFRRSFSRMWDQNADNIFMVKLNYWMNI